MLPKEVRLSAEDFKGLKTKLLYRGGFLDVAGTPAKVTKYACIIAKKRIRRAVDRNKAKRKVYAALRGITPPQPFLILIYPTKTILSTPQTVIQEELKKVFATL